jgi:hypothetical protein
MPQTLTATVHPILVERVETRLVWVEAASPERAREKAGLYAAAQDSQHLPCVDTSFESCMLTEPVADWLHISPDEVERLDAYFAARKAG